MKAIPIAILIFSTLFLAFEVWFMATKIDPWWLGLLAMFSIIMYAMLFRWAVENLLD